VRGVTSRYPADELDRAMRPPANLVVLTDSDPVSREVAAEIGTGEGVGISIEGDPIRFLTDDTFTVRRPGPHIFDERLDAKLPEEFRAAGTVLVFPSVHRSDRGYDALTVHPLGNPGMRADVGGRPGVLVPSAPRRMTGALRGLAEGSGSVGWPVCFEATHHGPELASPAFFIEVGGQDPDYPPAAATRLIAHVLRDLREESADHVALGVGGGHYAPHFTDLALRRGIAFGHILPRHVLDALAAETARSAWIATPGAEGVVYARAADAERPVAREWGRRFRESEAPRRGEPSTPRPSTGADARSAGT
jgi:D-aminoacyl-tRNA deacylase